MGGLLSKVALGWLGRRALDWGGWLGVFIGGALQFWNGLSPQGQEFVITVLSGNWKGITLGALAGFVPLVVSQIASYRTTVKPQTVTPDGIRVPFEALPPDTKAETVIAARQVAARRKKPSLLERLSNGDGSLTGG